MTYLCIDKARMVSESRAERFQISGLVLCMSIVLPSARGFVLSIHSLQSRIFFIKFCVRAYKIAAVAT